MSKTLGEISQQLKDANKKVQLIYAFNSTGKTRLSREFKELIAPKPDGSDDDDTDQLALSRNKILYYSAFTEDLFYWDNDLKEDAQPKLKIQPNSFTDWVLKDQGQDRNIITNFQRYTADKLTPRFNPEYKVKDKNDRDSIVKAFSEVTFSLESGDSQRLGNLKISKGEESNFIWSIFYTLLDEVIGILNIPEPDDRESNEFDQLEYVFIDDPVSSLDENHLIELAVNLAGLIKSSYFSDDEKKGIRFIITTHSPLFYNVLFNELNGKTCYMLERFDNGTFALNEKKGDSNKSFSYHLHIKHIIEQASTEGKIEKYHFTLLRNLYEKTASFLGYPRWSDLLDSMIGDKQGYLNRIIQFSSHRTLSNEEIVEPTQQEKEMVKRLLENLSKYGYWQQEKQSD